MKIDKNKVFSVRELNFAAKQLIENGLPLLWVRGEISNFVVASSGHWYFSLKDSQAQVRCVMFRHKRQFIDWQPTGGSEVEVLALPSLYEARGEFQLTLEQMRPAGMGALYVAFENLKNKLESEGLFAESRKRKFPYLPSQIGIVTSPQAAALRDVLATLYKRMPNLPIVLYPTPVQGLGSAQKIAEAIMLANYRKECDVLIVCRGGGSLEDLWAFNEELVARAISVSKIPVICGIGHETDFTIADFVSDQRAATPTAAAQFAIPDRFELMQQLFQLGQRFKRTVQYKFEAAMQRTDYLQRRLIHPAQRVQQQIQHLKQLQHRLQSARPNLPIYYDMIKESRRRITSAMYHTLERYDHNLAATQQHLLHLDPHQVLARGYSMVRNIQGEVVTDSIDLGMGEKLEITFARGWSRVKVETLKN